MIRRVGSDAVSGVGRRRAGHATRAGCADSPLLRPGRVCAEESYHGGGCGDDTSCEQGLCIDNPVIGDLEVKICAQCVTDDCEDDQHCVIGGWNADMDEIRANCCDEV